MGHDLSAGAERGPLPRETTDRPGPPGADDDIRHGTSTSSLPYSKTTRPTIPPTGEVTAMQRWLTYTASVALVSTALMAPRTAQAQAVSVDATTGDYSLTLKVLPAESFTGAHAEMARDAGAKANTLDGPGHPNHHMVVFIKKGNKPVEDAVVSITYRKIGQKSMDWSVLPVARMHVKGKGLTTTHFGNNLYLAPGSYEARVIVNGSSPALFNFRIAGQARAARHARSPEARDR
jgi:hypothetical protein